MSLFRWGSTRSASMFIGDDKKQLMFSNGWTVNGEIYWGDNSGCIADLRYYISLLSYNKKYIPNPYFEVGLGIGAIGKDDWKFEWGPVIGPGIQIALPGNWNLSYQLNYKHNFSSNFDNILQHNIVLSTYYTEEQAGNLDFPEHKAWLMGLMFPIWTYAVFGTIFGIIL